jgi:hypothetical protein
MTGEVFVNLRCDLRLSFERASHDTFALNLNGGRVLRSSMLLTLLSLTACGTSHVVLMAPRTAPGRSFVCQANTNPGNCTPAPDSDPSSQTVSGTRYVNLPPECNGLVNKVIVRDISKDTASVFVICAPPENQSGSTP